MNTNTISIEQQANVTLVSGNVQLIRDGFFLPAQVGMVLLPGDRVLSDTNAKAVIQFTGVNDALVIEKGAAATFNLEVVEMDEAPQWIATDLYGQGVYFDSQAAVGTAQANEEAPNLFGLFSSGSGDTGSAGESTGYPVLESVLALGATAAIFSDNDNNNSSTANTPSSTSSESNSGGNENSPPSNPPPTSTPQPPEEPQPEPNPLNGIIEPIGSALDSLLGTTGTTPPLNTLGSQSQNDVIFSSLPSTALTG